MSSARANGVDLFYQERGSGTPLFLIHGNGCTASVWDGVSEPLAKTFRVIAHDRRCYGQSKAPMMSAKGYYELHAEDAAQLLQKLGATPAVVVGWSGGGLIALHLALCHPELIEHLVLVEPPLHAKRNPTFPMLKAFVTLNLQRAFGRKRAAARTFFRWATSYTSGGCAFDKLDAPTQEAMLDNAEITLTELDAGTGEEMAAEQIAAIGCPVTCLLGQLTPRAIASATTRLAEMLPHAEVVPVEGAAHMLHVDQPARFVQAVEALALARAPARAAS